MEKLSGILQKTAPETFSWKIGNKNSSGRWLSISATISFHSNMFLFFIQPNEKKEIETGRLYMMGRINDVSKTWDLNISLIYSHETKWLERKTINPAKNETCFMYDLATIETKNLVEIRCTFLKREVWNETVQVISDSEQESDVSEEESDAEDSGEEEELGLKALQDDMIDEESEGDDYRPEGENSEDEDIEDDSDDDDGATPSTGSQASVHKTGEHSKKRKYEEISIALPKERSAALKGSSTIVKDNSTVVKESSTAVKENSTVVKESSIAVKENSTVVRVEEEDTAIEQNKRLGFSQASVHKTGESSKKRKYEEISIALPKERSAALKGSSTAVKENSTVVKESSTAVKENSTVVKESSTVEENTAIEQNKRINKRGLDALSGNLKNAFLSGEDTDVVIKVGEQEYRAHKVILKNRSPVFCSMLRYDMVGKNQRIVDISDCDSDIFRDFLLYLYSGKADCVSKRNVFDLYYMSNKYDVGSLKFDCVDFILNNLDIDIICNVIALATRHQEQEMLKRATSFFILNAKEIVLTSNWQKFIKEYPTQANELIIKAFNEKS